MKKNLVALATLAAAGVASAQSSVTLFGILDASVSHYATKSVFQPTNPSQAAPLVPPAGQKQSQTVLANSGYNTSRLGFRGTEDLGGGMAAGFWLEAGLNNDDGRGSSSAGDLQFNRRSTVSLSGDFGELRLGRDLTPTYWNDWTFDPHGNNGVGTTLLFRVNAKIASTYGPGSAIAASDTYVRAGNSIGYFLPRNLGGFYGQAMYALPETIKSGDTNGSPSKKGRYIGARFGYANGPLDIAAAYSQSIAADTATPATGTVTATQDRKINIFNLGASYDFGPFKLIGEFGQTQDRNELGATTTVAGVPAFNTTRQTDKYNGYLLGVTAPFGVGLVRASYSSVKYKNGAAPASSANNGDARADQWAVSYVHNLSKRTALYAGLSHINLKNAANNPLIMGVATGGSPAYLSSGGYAPKSASGYDFGIRHAF